MEEKDILRNKLINEGFDCYIFYLVTGDENKICERLNRRYSKVYFLTLRRMMHRSKDGKKWDEEDILFRRYIFAFIDRGESIGFMSEIGSLIYLNDHAEDGKLTGDNYDFARWVLEIDGLIGLSKAILEDGKVKITGGPLLRMKDQITKYSKRNRNCFVSMSIANIKIETWLPFEWE